jgi:glutaredoxin
MEKKSILKIALLLVGIGLLIAGLWYWTGPQSATEINSDIVLFYGRECPHCRELEKFLGENKIAEKVKFNQLEVFYNSANQAILTEKAKICGVAEASIGVPFLFNVLENKCLIGAPDIEDFFAKKAGDVIE